MAGAGWGTRSAHRRCCLAPGETGPLPCAPHAVARAVRESDVLRRQASHLSRGCQLVGRIRQLQGVGPIVRRAARRRARRFRPQPRRVLFGRRNKSRSRGCDEGLHQRYGPGLRSLYRRRDCRRVRRVGVRILVAASWAAPPAATLTRPFLSVTSLGELCELAQSQAWVTCDLLTEPAEVAIAVDHEHALVR